MIEPEGLFIYLKCPIDAAFSLFHLTQIPQHHAEVISLRGNAWMIETESLFIYLQRPLEAVPRFLKICKMQLVKARIIQNHCNCFWQNTKLFCVSG